MIVSCLQCITDDIAPIASQLPSGFNMYHKCTNADLKGPNVIWQNINIRERPWHPYYKFSSFSYTVYAVQFWLCLPSQFSPSIATISTYCQYSSGIVRFHFITAHYCILGGPAGLAVLCHLYLAPTVNHSVCWPVSPRLTLCLYFPGFQLSCVIIHLVYPYWLLCCQLSRQP